MNPIRSILHWPSAAGHLLSRVASPAIFGADPSLAPMAGEPNPLGQALSTAGTTLALSQGGPRRWGEFAASPLASITAGLAAGQQVYRDAQSNTRRRRAYDAVPLPAEGPTLPYLSQLFRTAVMQGDEPTAREIAGMASSHAFLTPPGATTSGVSLADQLTQARIDELKHRRNPFKVAVAQARVPAASSAAVPKPPTPAERTGASQAESATRSVDIMERIAHNNPGAAQEALAFIHGRELPLHIGDAVNMFRGTPSQDAQDFISSFGNFQLATTPIYGGARPTVQLLGLERLASTPGVGAADFTVPFQNMRSRLNDLRAKANQPALPVDGAPAQGAPAGSADYYLNRFKR